MSNVNIEDDNPIITNDCVELTNAHTKQADSEDKADSCDIDPNVLLILGEDPSTINSHGDDLNQHVASRWQHILLNGLSKEVKTEILKQYLVPANCTHLKAPKLNPEMKAALNEANFKKDFFSEAKQNQLSSCLTALGKVLDKALELNLNQDILKPLSDAGRLLCDYHHRESQSRRFAIMNTLNKETRNAVKDTKIDEYLFGSELADQLKSAKAISKSGSDMRTTSAPRPPFKPFTNVAQRGALNSRGASRPAATETRPAPYPTARPRRPAAAGPPPPPFRQQHRDRGRNRDSTYPRNYNRQRYQNHRN